MSTSIFSTCSRTLFFGLISQLLLVLDPINAQLQVGYYSTTCPRAEEIVKEVVQEVLEVAPSLSGPLLRLHFHDCFVRGCEASLLLNSPTHQAEKDAVPNQTLRGFQSIDRVKSALEKECPGIVSCADILALVARDVTVATTGPHWDVETGRRDGFVSNITEALDNIIPPFISNISVLITRFQGKGLDVKDLVVLSGGHTIGTSHCSSFSNRIYGFNSTFQTDPTLDGEYIPYLMEECKPNDNTTLVEMDPGSVRTFDTKYFSIVKKRRGLFQSDAALLDDSFIKSYIEENIMSPQGSTFFYDFGVSMIKMGRISVITGSEGEIREFCYSVNK